MPRQRSSDFHVRSSAAASARASSATSTSIFFPFFFDMGVLRSVQLFVAGKSEERLERVIEHEPVEQLGGFIQPVFGGADLARYALQHAAAGVAVEVRAHAPA